MKDVINGCPNCGNKFFRYLKEKKDKDGIETISIKKDGVYEINIGMLMNSESVIVSDKEGRYAIDLNFMLKRS